MLGSSNFLVFNPNNVENTDTDGEYLAEVQRINGLQSGIAKTAMHNKFYRQVSVMVAAIAQFMANEGHTVRDNDLASLVTVIQDTFETPAGAQFKVDVHAGNTSNPHDTSAEQTGAIPLDQKGQPNGVGTLDSEGNPVQKSYVAGTYTGNGMASRTISLGFKPKAIFVLKDGNFVSLRKNGTIPGYIYGGLAIDGSPLVTGSFVALEAVASGFTVSESSAASEDNYFALLNTSGSVYKYVVFR